MKKYVRIISVLALPFFLNDILLIGENGQMEPVMILELLFLS